MKHVQRGFTLIELVMVIVILGVLAAVALPKFVDLKGDAVAASTQGVAGGLHFDKYDADPKCDREFYCHRQPLISAWFRIKTPFL